MAFRIVLPHLWIGAAYKASYRVESRDELCRRKSGVPVDLTGLNGLLQLRESASSDTVLAEWSTDNGLLTFDDTNRFTIQLDADDTEDYNFEDAVWDLLTWQGVAFNEATVMAYGSIEASQVVTRLL